MTSEPRTSPVPLEPEEALERVAEAAHGPLGRLWDTLDGTVLPGVLEAVGEARDGHARLVAACGFAEDPGPAGASRPEADRLEPREALRRYRHGIMADVLDPLEQAFRLQPTRQVGEAASTACREAYEAATALPARPDVRWGAGALEPMPGDRRGRRARKAIARWISPARKADRVRAAPLRAVGLRHVRDRTAPLLDEFGSRTVGAWAAWMLSIERACADWSERAFPALCWGEVEAGPPASMLSSPDAQAPAAGEGEGAPPDRAPASDEDPWVRAHRVVARAARALDAALATALDAPPHATVREAAEVAARDALHALSSDVRAVGSLVHRPKGTVAGVPPLPHLERAADNLVGWDDQGAARLALYRTFLGVLTGSAAVQDRLAGTLRDMVLAPMAGAMDEAVALDALAEEVRRTDGPIDLEGLDRLRKSAAVRIEAALANLPAGPAVEEALGGAVDRALEAFQGMLRQLPERVVLHRVETRAPETLRAPDTRVVTLQEAARQSLDALRVERMRTGVLDLARRYAAIRTSVAELPDVIDFAFEAARKELSGPGPESGSGPESGEGTDEPGGGDDDELALHPATAFTLEALERTADVLETAPSDVAAAVRQAEARFAGEVAAGETALHQRLLAGRVTSQIFRARSVFADTLTGLEERFGPRWRRIRRRLRIVWKRTARRIDPALQWIKALISDGTPPKGRAQRTLRAFAQEDSGPGHVPLVYQRLFALAPVADASFMVGREGEVAEVLERFRRWREEDEVPVVVRGLPGRGVSSFLKAVARVVADEGADVREVELPERILDEGVLVTRLAEVLGVEDAGSLEELASVLLAAPKGSVPDAVIVDGLEHLYLRVPGGTDLLERFLTFLSESEPRVFWAVGISQPAWKLISMAEPFAVLQVHDIELGPLSQEQLRETVLRRHRRSGLRLRFAEPREGRALLRRRLRRLRGTDAHQAVLADDFFAQLHRAALGDLKLALFHWMLAADFEASEGEVLLRPPVRPDFDILETLRPAQQYALKAFLEHRTLTLTEHDAVFRMPHQESYQIFESLQNRHLIEEMDTRAAWERSDSEIRRTSRYRIRPLLVGAVIEHLGTRNIVH